MESQKINRILQMLSQEGVLMKDAQKAIQFGKIPAHWEERKIQNRLNYGKQ